jgi:RecA-family ATPase
MSSPEESDQSLGICAASQVVARAVAWLWLYRLALGKLAVLDGDPDLGKSLVALDLCARLSTGRSFPDGSPSPGPCNSLVLNSEDDAEGTVRPRLQALGADLDRVFIWRREADGGGERPSFPSGIDRLDRMLARTKAKLVVIDPVPAFLDPGVVTEQAVRRVLDALAALAEKHQCVILLIRHLNKSGGRRALYRGSGSIGIVGACRSGWLIARDPGQPDRYVLAQQKNNLAPPQPSLAYGVQARDGDLSALTWLGAVPWTADQLLAGTAEGPRTGLLERACDFLNALLEAGPRSVRDIWQAAQERDLSESTLRWARKKLGVRSERVRVDGKQMNYWLLNHQELPEGLRPPSDTPELDAWLERLREQYPPSTPLDEDDG